MNDSKIAFIGCGNMARSLIGGMIANGMPIDQLTASDPDESQRQGVSDQFGIETYSDNIKAIQNADVVVLAIKPQVIHDAVTGIADELEVSDSLIISIVAGVRLDSILQWLKHRAAIIRVMPNTPALIQAGAAALLSNEHATEDQNNTAEAMMRSVGTTVWLDNEDQMDGITALSGSGPAYFFYFMEAMEKAAEGFGLDKDQARLLTIETALGAAKMALLSTHDPETLRKQVTSPGGTTEQALNVFMKSNLDKIIEEAMSAAKQRSKELSDEFGKS